jgi:tRNA A-37 threonylcarbamoyl transferase component Bud32
MAGVLAQTIPDTLPMTDRGRPSPAELAAHFPNLDILEYLGRGGMGVVYKARQKSLNRLVALKLLAPERVGDERFAQRFAKEAQALAALNHPNIVTIYDFGQVGGFFYLLMEFVDGVNLRQAMRAARFTPDEALAIVPPICAALQYAHEHGIVHRDIKPENLLLDKEGHVKIADFGIAKMLNAEASDVGVTESLQAGTPQYMAPEQKASRHTDHRADIYSLGVLLYELLTGELPGKPLTPPSKKVAVDVRLDELVLRALDEKPERRYQTIAEVKTLVETVSATAAAQQQSMTKAARRHRLFTQAGIAVLTLSSIAAIWTALSGIGWTAHSHKEGKQEMNTNTSAAVLASLLAVTGCVETAMAKQSWASIGETKEEALKKCGEPELIPSMPDWTAMGVTVAEYPNGKPRYRHHYYTNRKGKSVLGAIYFYSWQTEKLTEPIIKQILKDNSDGKEWRVIKGAGTTLDSYSRDGVSAHYWHFNDADLFIVELTDFQDYCRVKKDRIEEQKAAKPDDNLREIERKTVTLTKPYPTAGKGATTDKISVQYAVIELGKQAGLGYKWDESFKNTDPFCREWVYPEIKNMPFRAAMQGLLEPVGLTYAVRENAIVLEIK